jgi:formylglycine-generating enzyme required for sulfatase activity
LIESAEITEAGASRRLNRDRFPLSLGGSGALIVLPGVAPGLTVAWIGLADGEPFLQATDPAEVVACNGSPVATSQWLEDGDVIRIASARITVRRDDLLRLEVEQVRERDVTEPPLIVARETASPTGATVRPVEFKPRLDSVAPPRTRRVRPLTVVVALLFALLAGVAWLAFSLEPVRVDVEPAPDRLAIEGTRFGWQLAGRHMLLPGSYTLIAEKAGWRRLDAPFEVTRGPDQVVRFQLKLLPGRLIVDAGSVVGAEVVVDGEVRGSTPLNPLELENGEHVVRVVADRHDPFEATIEIEGRGTEQTLKVELVPRWAAIGFDSDPQGATLKIAGSRVGATPLTEDLLAGTHRFELSLSGYKTYRGSVTVVANQPQALPRVGLQKEDAVLTLRSEPSEASVTVGEDYRGRTPVELFLAPGRTHRIRLTRPGYDPALREVRLEAGDREELNVVLDSRKGEVEIVTTPAGAELIVNGESRGAANQVLELVATPHRIQVKKEGYEPYSVTVTPRPGFPQSIEVVLKTEEQIKAEATPSLIRSPQGHRMVLIHGGEFQTGAPRREPGRRANEVVRQIVLERPFYLSTTEVTNEEFHEFRTRHRSGRIGQHNLEIGHHPVVRVSWDEAARYCNWLSAKEGLPPAYLETGGAVVGVDPLSTGYRLPTEAEWVWAARYAGGSTPLKYTWGQSLPVPPDAGNFADLSAEGLVSPTLDGYDDHFPATAPAASFRPNPLGLFNMGGNVTEWMHDVYSASGPGGGKVEKDPVGTKSGAEHAIRGASWMDASVSELRLSFRDGESKPRADLGFRIARYAE